MTQTESKAEADAFGRNHFTDQFVESIEIDARSRAEAEEFWGVRTVRLVHVVLDPNAKMSSRRRLAKLKPVLTFKTTWVVGPELPEDVEEDDLLTPEDRGAITLDHISRTCETVVKFEFSKRS